MAINATETANEKPTFERDPQSKGVSIKLYYTKNGIFNTSVFMKELLKKQ